MTNKKGVIRTLEAVISIILVFMFIYSISPQEFNNLGFRNSEAVSEIHTKILDDILKDEGMRECFLKTDFDTDKCYIYSNVIVDYPDGKKDNPPNADKIIQNNEFLSICQKINLKTPLTNPPPSHEFGEYVEAKIKEVISEQGAALPPQFSYAFVVNPVGDNCVPAKMSQTAQIFSRSVVLAVATDDSVNPLTDAKVARIYVWSGI
ncbi:MAG: hypothetical protein UV40_C0007G0011 [Parcubacteria group bacterium GW2011_GWA1_42_7]|nr:MAG: hypothetical protein UV40_C0007G0011 [Parcubacteria group bacterium GW2011_GWA1_42_7]MBS3166823.1 hypothetical protein [Candidatus Woesearchaeota archaeon]